MYGEAVSRGGSGGDAATNIYRWLCIC
ncbi:hypothetical protein [Chryseobacterium sp. CH1]|nr:hypothetical protein [Chryseobacterium sp. CH1]